MKSPLTLLFIFFLSLNFIDMRVFSAENNDSKTTDAIHLQSNFVELELGSAFNLDSNLRNHQLGLGLYASIVQNHLWGIRLDYVSLFTGGEFRYNCLRNSTSENCLFMVGPVFSFKETNEIVSWIEYQLDFRGGFAYSRVNSNLVIPEVVNGALGYISVNPGISFFFKRIGLRASYFFDTLFFSDDIILSHAGSFSLFTRF